MGSVTGSCRSSSCDVCLHSCTVCVLAGGRVVAAGCVRDLRSSVAEGGCAPASCRNLCLTTSCGVVRRGGGTRGVVDGVGGGGGFSSS